MERTSFEYVYNKFGDIRDIQGKGKTGKPMD